MASDGGSSASSSRLDLDIDGLARLKPVDVTGEARTANQGVLASPARSEAEAFFRARSDMMTPRDLPSDLADSEHEASLLPISHVAHASDHSDHAGSSMLALHQRMSEAAGSGSIYLCPREDVYDDDDHGDHGDHHHHDDHDDHHHHSRRRQLSHADMDGFAQAGDGDGDGDDAVHTPRRVRAALNASSHSSSVGTQTDISLAPDSTFEISGSLSNEDSRDRSSSLPRDRGSLDAGEGAAPLHQATPIRSASSARRQQQQQQQQQQQHHHRLQHGYTPPGHDAVDMSPIHVRTAALSIRKDALYTDPSPLIPPSRPRPRALFPDVTRGHSSVDGGSSSRRVRAGSSDESSSLREMSSRMHHDLASSSSMSGSGSASFQPPTYPASSSPSTSRPLYPEIDVDAVLLRARQFMRRLERDKLFSPSSSSVLPRYAATSPVGQVDPLRRFHASSIARPSTSAAHAPVYSWQQHGSRH